MVCERIPRGSQLPKIILDRSKLDLSYIPARLPHREAELREIAEVLERGTGPLLIYGKTGVGKTAVSRRALKEAAKSAGLRYAYVNCSRFPRTASRVMSDLLKQLGEGLPDRGISLYDQLALLENFVIESNGMIAIVLDEVQDLGDRAEEVVYSLLRLHEISLSPQLTRLIVIYREESVPQFLLEESTLSFFTRKLRFKPYTESQLVDIVRARAEEALRSGSFDGEVLREIARLTSKYAEGNARQAILLLRFAADIAEREGADALEVRHVLLADSIEHPAFDLSILDELDLHDRLLLLAAARVQARRGRGWLTMGELEEEYRLIAESYGVPAYKHTATWRRVKNMGSRGVLEIRRSGKGLRGQTTLISVRAPADELAQTIEAVLDRTVGKWPPRGLHAI